MATYFNKNVYLNLLLFIIGNIGVLSIEVATTMPHKVENILRQANGTEINNILSKTRGSRRILSGKEAAIVRPYMVYLKLPINSIKFHSYRRWLCGGVIIHEEYILTSAACIEDVKHFYVVSGTYKHSEYSDRFNNLCIKNGARKAIWKCVPRNYFFHGQDTDDISWMSNDIAVVKVDEEFDFTRRVRGCDYIPRPIRYNNESTRFEQPNTEATIAGWGSVDRYDLVNSRRPETQNLLEANVVLISKNHCKKRWGRRYHYIIENYMICTMDIGTVLTEICDVKYVECTEIDYSDEYSGKFNRRVLNPETLSLHSAHHNTSDRRKGDYDEDIRKPEGGFCENDHGGPLVYGERGFAMVIGIISACLVKERTNECHGPFLYTSVYKNRILINCAVNKDSSQCKNMFRRHYENRVEVEMSWIDHPDGPAKNEQKDLSNRNIQTNVSIPASKQEQSKMTTIIVKLTPKDQNTKKIKIAKSRSEPSILKIFNIPEYPLQHTIIKRSENSKKLNFQANDIKISTNVTIQIDDETSNTEFKFRTEDKNISKEVNHMTQPRHEKNFTALQNDDSLILSISKELPPEQKPEPKSDVTNKKHTNEFLESGISKQHVGLPLRTHDDQKSPRERNEITKSKTESLNSTGTFDQKLPLEEKPEPKSIINNKITLNNNTHEFRRFNLSVKPRSDVKSDDLKFIDTNNVTSLKTVRRKETASDISFKNKDLVFRSSIVDNVEKYLRKQVKTSDESLKKDLPMHHRGLIIRKPNIYYEEENPEPIHMHNTYVHENTPLIHKNTQYSTDPLPEIHSEVKKDNMRIAYVNITNTSDVFLTEIKPLAPEIVINRENQTDDSSEEDPHLKSNIKYLLHSIGMVVRKANDNFGSDEKLYLTRSDKKDNNNLGTSDKQNLPPEKSEPRNIVPNSTVQLLKSDSEVKKDKTQISNVNITNTSDVFRRKTKPLAKNDKKRENYSLKKDLPLHHRGLIVRKPNLSYESDEKKDLTRSNHNFRTSDDQNLPPEVKPEPKNIFSNNTDQKLQSDSEVKKDKTQMQT